MSLNLSSLLPSHPQFLFQQRILFGELGRSFKLALVVLVEGLEVVGTEEELGAEGGALGLEGGFELAVLEEGLLVAFLLFSELALYDLYLELFLVPFVCQKLNLLLIQIRVKTLHLLSLDIPSNCHLIDIIIEFTLILESRFFPVFHDH
jgi:hypothetical protein